MRSLRASANKINDPPELKQIFTDYYDRLVFFSWQILKEQQQAEDVAQDAFIAYWQQRDQVSDHPVAIKNFLYRSAKNASLNLLRHAQIINKYNAAQPAAEPAEDVIEEAIISSEVMAEIHAALETLPPNLLKVSRLSFLEGKKNQQVADELGLSVNTVKKQKQRALELLRSRLRPDTFLLLLAVSEAFVRRS